MIDANEFFDKAAKAASKAKNAAGDFYESSKGPVGDAFTKSRESLDGMLGNTSEWFDGARPAKWQGWAVAGGLAVVAVAAVSLAAGVASKLADKAEKAFEDATGCEGDCCPEGKCKKEAPRATGQCAEGCC